MQSFLLLGTLVYDLRSLHLGYAAVVHLAVLHPGRGHCHGPAWWPLFHLGRGGFRGEVAGTLLPKGEGTARSLVVCAMLPLFTSLS